MKLIINELKGFKKYGRIKIETRLGVLEYSYTLWSDDEPEWQLEQGHDIEQALTDDEQSEVFEIIRAELYK